MWDYIVKNLPLLIILTLAIIICGADLIKAIAVWKQKRKESIDKEVNKIRNADDLSRTLQNLNTGIESLNQKIEGQDERFAKIEARLTDLTLSDMHDTKAWIVDQYHKFYVEQGWIDAFNADTIEHRYEDYKREGGNSYIDQLIERLRSLPLNPPQE